MPCKVVKVNDQFLAVTCSRQRAERCFYCSTPSEKLCDYPINTGTCDKPLCYLCAYHMPKDFDFCKDHKPEIIKEVKYQIAVVNWRHRQDAIYIGREMSKIGLTGSALGNPYHQTHYGLKALQLYKQWLWKHIKLRDEVFQALQFIKRNVLQYKFTNLGCWCVPKNPCHGDIVKAAVYWMIREGIE